MVGHPRVSLACPWSAWSPPGLRDGSATESTSTARWWAWWWSTEIGEDHDGEHAGGSLPTTPLVSPGKPAGAPMLWVYPKAAVEALVKHLLACFAGSGSPGQWTASTGAYEW